MEIKNVTVIGAGTMGNGIAHTFAQYGFSVTLNDIKSEFIERGLNTIHTNLDRQVKKAILTEDQRQQTLSRIKPTSSLSDAAKNADIVVEAATEDKSIKMEVFRTLDNACPAYTILASNTSSISITELARVTKRPEKVIGMHFMNPVPVMKLVELIRGLSTSNETFSIVSGLSQKLDKVAVEVND